MLCNKYSNLSLVEKIRFIGELVHCVQNDDDSFQVGKALIVAAKINGVLDGVVILPENNEQD